MARGSTALGAACLGIVMLVPAAATGSVPRESSAGSPLVSAGEPDPADMVTVDGADLHRWVVEQRAKDADVPVEVAEAQHRAQIRIEELSHVLSEQFAEYLASVRFDEERLSGTVLLTEAAPADVVAEIRELATASGATVTAQATLNGEALARQTAALTDRLAVAHPGVRPLLVKGNRDRTGLIVETSSGDVRPTAEEFSRETGLPVDVQVYPEFGGEPQASIVGGAQLNRPDGSAACTSAFTIDHPTRSPQLLTADHCPDDLNYGNNNWLTLSGFGGGYWGDLQRHSSTETEIPKFQFASGQLTTNKTSAGYMPVIDGRYNRYGRYSTQTGVRVNELSVCATYDAKQYCNLAETELGTTSQHGDSGGPWWTGASGGAAAVGIHSGCVYYLGTDCNTNVVKRDLFTPAAHLDNAFGSGWLYMTG